MSSISRFPRQVLTVLTLAALLAAPLTAGAAPAERRAVTSATDDGGWAGLLAAPWRALQDLILSMTGADGTEDPPPPPPPDDDDDDLRPHDSPTCPTEQSGGPCVEPTG